jgi:hypothetical protein
MKQLGTRIKVRLAQVEMVISVHFRPLYAIGVDKMPTLKLSSCCVLFRGAELQLTCFKRREGF